MKAKSISSDSFSLPDVDAAQYSERHTEDESHGHGQQRGQQAVKDELDQLKGGVASYPHSVEAVRGRGLRDDIFKTNLSGQPSHAKTKKVIITHGGLCARTQAATSRYSGLKCYTGTTTKKWGGGGVNLSGAWK